MGGGPENDGIVPENGGGDLRQGHSASRRRLVETAFLSRRRMSNGRLRADPTPRKVGKVASRPGRLGRTRGSSPGLRKVPTG